MKEEEKVDFFSFNVIVQTPQSVNDEFADFAFLQPKDEDFGFQQLKEVEKANSAQTDPFDFFQSNSKPTFSFDPQQE